MVIYHRCPCPPFPILKEAASIRIPNDIRIFLMADLASPFTTWSPLPICPGSYAAQDPQILQEARRPGYGQADGYSTFVQKDALVMGVIQAFESHRLGGCRIILSWVCVAITVNLCPKEILSTSFCRIILSRVCVAITVNLCPKEILYTSFTNRAAAAMALKHLGQPLATESSFLDK